MGRNDPMNLPEFLTEAPYGEILLRGHRIGLFHVIAYHRDGHSIQQLHEQYPTLPLELLRKVLDYYPAHPAEVDAYMKHCQEQIEQQRATTPRALDWEELKRRCTALTQEGT
jgi:uncharacterized protein (DUF433 family)